MRRKSFYKELLRSISRSKARFISILIIITIGVGFFAGINATEPDMILSANQYYVKSNLSDLRIVSPLGFTKEDIKELLETPGVKRVQEGYSKDLFLRTTNGNSYTVRLYSFNKTDFNNKEGLNRFVLKEGRLPINSGEIVVEAGDFSPKGLQIGSQITFDVPTGENIDDFVKSQSYTVVGKIVSPLYISFERGQTNVGDGSIDLYTYINEIDFTLEKVSDLFVQTDNSLQTIAYSEDYHSQLAPVLEAIEKLGGKITAQKTEDMRQELLEGKKELEKSQSTTEKELDKAEQDLKQAEMDIEEGERELLNNETHFSYELQSTKKELVDAQIQLKSGIEIYEENYSKWQAGYSEYETGLQELSSAEKALNLARVEIELAEQELAKAKQQIETGRIEIDKLRESHSRLRQILETFLSKPPNSNEEYLELIASSNLYPQEVEDSLTNIDYSIRSIPLIIGTVYFIYDETGKNLVKAEEEYIEGMNSLEEGEKQFEAAKTEYDNGYNEYQSSLLELQSAQVELDKGKIELDQAKFELNSNEERIEDGLKEIEVQEKQLTTTIEKGRSELEQAKLDLTEGWKKFEQEKKSALKKIKEAEIEIKQAEQDLLKIPEGWFVFTRDQNPGYTGYGDDAKRIGAVAKVFPLFFFLVASLVCLTTMTRMIEEERVQIGILKALGYSTFMIASKYLVYALISSLTGSIIGLVIGYQLFPKAIMNAYDIMYNIPEKITRFHLDYAIISIVIALLTTMMAALFATFQVVRSTPSILMQPRAPKPGKRILLERFKPLWKRLSFSQKITFRNIFRYKQRFFMTVFGISGCTALLITGFGLSDSINDILGKQFDEIFLYDGQVIANTKEDNVEENMVDTLEVQTEVHSFLPIQSETVDSFRIGSNKAFEANLIIPKITENVGEFIDLHKRTTKSKVEIPDNGAIITEKLATLLDVGIGDLVKVRNAENMTFEIPVVNIVENYLSHYIYLSPTYYEEITNDSPTINSAYFKIKDKMSLDETRFKEQLIQNDSILSVIFLKSIADTFTDTIKSLDFVVFILIISAGSLAIVVLYNLTNINITERVREIATIKVLGFRNNEVDAYVYRENTILTLFGTLFGLILGAILHQYVINTMEIDAMMFGQEAHLLSYIWSIFLTILFSGFVNVFMHFKLKKINMVESLKSVD